MRTFYIGRRSILNPKTRKVLEEEIYPSEEEIVLSKLSHESQYIYHSPVKIKTDYQSWLRLTDMLKTHTPIRDNWYLLGYSRDVFDLLKHLEIEDYEQ